MNEHLKKSEAELNELLAEYWKLRHETGKLFLTLLLYKLELIHVCKMYIWKRWQTSWTCVLFQNESFIFNNVYICSLVTCLINTLLHLRFTTLLHPECQSSTVSPTLTGSTYPVVVIQTTMFPSPPKTAIMTRSAQCHIRGAALSALQVQWTAK